MSRPTKGSVREVRPGTWELRVGTGRDPVTNRYRTKYATVEGTEGQARKELAKMVRAVDAGEGTGTDGTVAWLLGIYLDHLEAIGTAATTVRAYRCNINRHIIPVLGNVPLSKLNAGHLDAFYSGLALRPATPAELAANPGQLKVKRLSPSTIHQNHTVLRGALKRAEAWGYVPTNVATKAQPPTVYAPEVCPPDVALVRQLLTAAAEYDPQLGAFAFLAAATGARRGELARLRWSDVDTVLATVRIDATKTHQIRRLGIDPSTVAVILHHMASQRRWAEELEVPMVANPYLFAKDAAGAEPRHADHFTGGWRRLAKREGHPGIRLHDLRHFVATQMIAGGHDIRTVAGQLGHGGGGAITLKVYAHVIGDRQRAAAGMMGDLLAGVGPGPAITVADGPADHLEELAR